MPSSYSASARLTLQATGENNNTWGVILNQGVFQLVDDNVNGRLAFVLSGAKVLTTALGAPDEARLAFLDVTGGTGGIVTLPSVSQGHWVRNASAGDVTFTAGAGFSAVMATGDIGPVFSDGSAVHPIRLGGKTLRDYINTGDQAVIDYVNLAISGASISLPPALLANVGQALMTRNIAGFAAWVPSPIATADVTGLAFLVEDTAVAFALTL